MMNLEPILLPVFVLVALTFGVWVRMFRMRVAQMRRERIHMESVATSAQAAELLTDSRAADNFRNLFELPVLFYLAAIVAALTGQVHTVTVTLAWLFVAMRIAHSLVHCTYNRVLHRFLTYMAGGFALFLLWVWLAIGILRG